MARVHGYIITMVGIALILSMSGIYIAGVSEILSKTNLTEGSLNDQSSFWLTVWAILIAAGTAGVIIGFITKSQSENYVTLPIITTGAFTLGSFVTLAYSIISAAFGYSSWIGYVTMMIFGPLTIGFVFSLIDWFKGIA